MISACEQTDPNIIGVWVFGIFLTFILLLTIIMGWLTR